MPVMCLYTLCRFCRSNGYTLSELSSLYTKGVHFIAIANSVDSDDQNSNEFAPFLNIMNEWYLRDLSRKQRTAIRVKGESGKPTTNCAIYGYKKMPGDKYSWYIDEEAAEVVRRIFRLTI